MLQCITLVIQYYQKARSRSCWVFITVAPFLWLPCFENESYNMYFFFVFSFYVLISVPNFLNRVFICVCYFGPRVFRTSHTYMYQLLLSSPTSIIALFTFAINACLLLRQAWMYCWLVFCCHFFQFFTLAIACLFAFVTPAGVFLERADTCICPFPTFPTTFLYVYYFDMRVFRTNHACIYPFPTQFPHRVACLYAFIVSARVFLERAIHAFFPFLFNFSNRYFGSAISAFFRSVCQLFQLRFSIRLLFRLAC